MKTKTKPTIRIGPDLSVSIVDGSKVTYASHLFHLKETDPALFAQVTREQLDECAARYPELKPAIEEFLAVHKQQPTTQK